MNDQGFMRIVNNAFAPFLEGLGFVEEKPSISGRFYRVSFKGPSHVVSVSYEPGDNALFIMVFSAHSGQLSDPDDPAATPRLSDLSARFMPTVTREERVENEAFFEGIAAHDPEEASLLKAAKELRLVLPRHLCS